MPLTISDVFRTSIVTVPELRSDGYGPNSIYFYASLTSTSATQIVTVNLTPGISPGNDVSLLYPGDIQVNPGDIIYLYNTQPHNIADGYYTINSILGDTTILVNEVLANSTDGYVTFMYPSGSLNVGFSTALYTPTHITHDNVQQALEDLDLAISQSSYLTKQVVVNFGTIPTNYKTFIVYDTDVTTNSLLFPIQAGNAPPGRSSDENEMDPIIFSATPNNGQFTLIASSKDGPVVGAYVVNYGIGTM